MNFCVSIPYEENELFYSWVLRLSQANAIDPRLFMQVFLNPQRYERPFITYGTPVFVRDLFSTLRIHVSEYRKVYTDTTNFSVEAPFLTREFRQQVILTSFESDMPYSSLFRRQPGYGTVKFCPECVREEIRERGYYTLKTYHQIPGVHVCRKHGTRLLVTGAKIRNNTTVPTGKEEQGCPLDLRFADFAWDFRHLSPDFSAEDVKNAVSVEVANRYGGSEEAFAKVLEEEGYAPLLSGNPLRRLRRVLKRQINIQPQDGIAILMALYGSAENAVLKINEKRVTGISEEAFRQEAENTGYSLVSPYRNDFVVLLHKRCGTEFVISPYGFQHMGFRCPVCASRFSTDQYVRFLFGECMGKDWELLSDAAAADDHIRIRHKSGQTYEVLLSDVLWKRLWQEKNDMIGESSARELVEKSGKYVLKGYHFAGRDRHELTIRCKKCGGTFTTTYKKWRESAYCRLCENPRNRSVIAEKFAEKIRTMTDGAYEVAGEYHGYKEKVAIRHLKCGRVKEYLPASFYGGQRCPYCRQPMSDRNLAFLINRLSMGKYELMRPGMGTRVGIRSVRTGSCVYMKRGKAVAEMRRNDSKIFPGRKVKDAANVRIENGLITYLKSKYGPEDIIFLPEEHSDKYFKTQREKDNLCATAVKHGEIFRLGHRAYCFTKRVLSDKELFYEKYVVRNGRRISFPYGKSLLYEMGIGDEPDSLWVVSNTGARGRLISGNTPFRYRIYGARIRVTEENYAFLAVSKLICSLWRYTDIPWEEIKEPIRNWYFHNGGRTAGKTEIEQVMTVLLKKPNQTAEQRMMEIFT